VARARLAQHRRTGAANAEAPLDSLTAQAAADALALAERASAQLGLSNRGFIRCFRVARSIADLAGESLIARAHMAEALAFRQRVSGNR
jgi:magnesium chelatase family protein